MAPSNVISLKCCCCQLEEASKLQQAELEGLAEERTALNTKIESLTQGMCFYMWHLQHINH